MYEKTSTLSISSDNCEGGLRIKLFNKKDSGKAALGLKGTQENKIFYPPESGALEIKFQLGEDACYTRDGDRNDCRIFVEARGVRGGFKSTEDVIEDYKSSPSLNFGGGIIMAECEPGFITLGGNCGVSSWELLSTNSATNANCNVSSVNFSPSEVKFAEDTRVSLTIKSTQCYEGFYVVPRALNGGSDVLIKNDHPNNFFIPPRNKNLIVYFEIDENGCYSKNDPDCQNYIAIYNSKEFVTQGSAGSWIYSEPWYAATDGGKPSPGNTPPGWFTGNCEKKESCDLNNNIISPEYWEFLGSNADNEANPVGSAEDVLLKETFNTESPCYKKEDGKEFYDPNCYETLAAIPGIGDKNADGVVDGSVIKNLRTFQLGDYINQLFLTALGILAVMAVIMIVIAGVQYMTLQSAFGKEKASERLTNAILGLILALGIFTILKTINPELLDVNFGAGIATVNASNINLDPAEQDGKPTSDGTLVSAPVTNSCINRKHRGYWKGAEELKKTTIRKTSTDGDLKSLEGSGFILATGTPQATTIKNSADKGFVDKLISLEKDLQKQNIQTRVTEAFGPSFLGHGSPCHYFGSCIDLGTKDKKYSAGDVEKIIKTADKNGLTAQFEFSKQQDKSDRNEMAKELKGKGIDECMILYVKNATNWHFSVYDKQNESIGL